ncbi:hypothetical protein IEQ34_012054 [Dendrobium chrysotoxum]|uniref:Uncharacterized protein n=1 Tax=Dendrobium chrysotoxum TaxID=161865 RepID=A0AAV7GBV6_DENCH|nr:hypothetical protein IEQ34_012054 [Dendrobium chrysotoxum]
MAKSTTGLTYLAPAENLVIFVVGLVLSLLVLSVLVPGVFTAGGSMSAVGYNFVYSPFRDKIQNDHINEKVEVAPMEDKNRESSLRWFGHIKR